jgi:hypothetical protein
MPKSIPIYKQTKSIPTQRGVRHTIRQKDIVGYAADVSNGLASAAIAIAVTTTIVTMLDFSSATT